MPGDGLERASPNIVDDLSAPWPPLPGANTFSTANAAAFLWDSGLARYWHLAAIGFYQGCDIHLPASPSCEAEVGSDPSF